MPAAVTMQGNEKKQECCEAALLENVTSKAHKSREPTLFHFTNPSRQGICARNYKTLLGFS